MCRHAPQKTPPAGGRSTNRLYSGLNAHARTVTATQCQPPSQLKQKGLGVRMVDQGGLR